MEWPQIAMIVLLALGCGVSLATHGKPQKPNNFITTVISTAILAWLLIAGGYFN